MIRWLTGSGLSWWMRAVVVAATLALSAAMIAAAPGPTGWIRFLAKYHTSSPDPLWDTPVDGAAFRRAAAYVSRGQTYYLWYPASNPQYSHDLLGAGLDFLTPALPVVHAADADWIVSYQTDRLTPPGIVAGRTIDLGDRIFLVAVKR
jgi:hypothetical protein